MSWTTEVRHCGVCSQCLDRRFAVLAADAQDFDPADGYEVDLLTGERHSDRDIRQAVAYVKFAVNVATSEKRRFASEHPEIYSIVGKVSGVGMSETIDLAWDLHRRHALSIRAVLETGLRDHAKDFLIGDLPRGSILALAVGGKLIEPPPNVDHVSTFAATLDRLQQPVCDFTEDLATQRILFRGDYSITGADYRIVAALLAEHRAAKSRAEEVHYVSMVDLCDRLGVDDQTLRTRLARLRKDVAARLAVDQGVVFDNEFIENRYGSGYRLAPALREVTLADLNMMDCAAVTISKQK